MASRYRKCKICKARKEVSTGLINGLDFVCGVEHLAELGLQRAAKEKQKAAKEWRAETRRRKTAAKPLAKWLAEAQRAFNAYIRERDAGLFCVSCDKPPGPQEYGGIWNAGHYRSVGACSALRFDERNVWKQCEQCNSHQSGNVREYRVRLIERIGEEAVQELETTNPLRRWTIDEAKAIKAEYKQKLKALREQEA